MNYCCYSCAVTVTAIRAASPAGVAQSVYQILAEIRNFSILANLETDSVKTTPNSTGTWVSFLGLEAVH